MAKTSEKSSRSQSLEGQAE
jgi:hypothetical protein